MNTHVQQTLVSPWQDGDQCSLQLLIQTCICVPGTHYGWGDRGSVENEVYPKLLHMIAGNRTPDFMILSPMPYSRVPQVFPSVILTSRLHYTIPHYMALVVGSIKTTPKKTSAITTLP